MKAKEQAMKNIFAVAVDNKDGKYCAYTVKLKTGANIHPFASHPRMECLHLCNSRKEAHAITEQWNEQYKANGTYYYDYLEV